MRAELGQFIAAVTVIDISVCKWQPIVIGVQMHRIVARPVIHLELLGIRRAPANTNCVHRFP